MQNIKRTETSSRRGVVVIVSGLAVKGRAFVVGIRQEGLPELKCQVAPSKSLVRKRMCNGRRTLNLHF